LRGLDESGKAGIVTDGLKALESRGLFRGITVGSKKSSQRKIKRRQEVDPIVRFFTSTG
jgi:hypothetical protein